ncbi:SIMPL domain-containing protein [Sphingomonas sp.]|uniref:SIMPL domain-containing protein n=1 Tax=Sphingomonas sp. TaxID=28214 RepID=UPI00286D9959|nr:SIMPL domain-containing protein [Sphingomonas sp.]
MTISILLAALAAGGAAAPAAAQIVPEASLADLAATPLVRVNIAETLRRPPDEASLTVGTEGRAPTATAAVAANKIKTERLLAAIRAAGLRERDIQTQGIQLQADYRYEQIDGRGQQRLAGYIATNSVLIKTRDIDSLTGLIDRLTEAGATTVYGPNFAIADPAPLRREARLRALARGAEEATEYARANGFTSVRLLSIEEGTSFRGTDVVVTGARVVNLSAPPPPPPPVPERDGGIVAPGQLDTGVSLGLLYRMER